MQSLYCVLPGKLDAFLWFVRFDFSTQILCNFMADIMDHFLWKKYPFLYENVFGKIFISASNFFDFVTSKFCLYSKKKLRQVIL